MYLYIFESESCSFLSDSLRPHGLQSLWNSPIQDTEVGSLSLLQEIFPTQGSNPVFPHCKDSLPDEPQGSKVKVAQSYPTLCNSMDCSLPGSSVHGILQARLLEWGAVPYSGRSSQLRNRIQVSHIAGELFTI